MSRLTKAISQKAPPPCSIPFSWVPPEEAPAARQTFFTMPMEVTAIDQLRLVVSGSWNKGLIMCDTGPPPPESISFTDPRAFYGALTVALAAHSAAGRGADGPVRFLTDLEPVLASKPGGTEFFRHVSAAAASVARGESTPRLTSFGTTTVSAKGFTVTTTGST